jgi:hypothetical protein
LRQELYLLPLFTGYFTGFTGMRTNPSILIIVISTCVGSMDYSFYFAETLKYSSVPKFIIFPICQF